MGNCTQDEMTDGSAFLLEQYKTVTILCPHCGKQSAVQSPTNQCVLAVECPRCHASIEKSDEDCCVFCSHAVSSACGA